MVGIQQSTQGKKNKKAVATEESELVSDALTPSEYKKVRGENNYNGILTSKTIPINGESDIGREIAKIMEHIIKTDICPRIDQLVERVENEEEDDMMKTEWRIVAMTVDRCLLIFFLVNFVLTLVGVFSLSPGYVA